MSALAHAHTYTHVSNQSSQHNHTQFSTARNAHTTHSFQKDPSLRRSAAELLGHPWLQQHPRAQSRGLKQELPSSSFAVPCSSATLSGETAIDVAAAADRPSLIQTEGQQDGGDRGGAHEEVGRLRRGGARGGGWAWRAWFSIRGASFCIDDYACVHWTRQRPRYATTAYLMLLAPSPRVQVGGAGALTAAAVAREAISAGTRAASGASFVAPRLLTAATAAERRCVHHHVCKSSQGSCI